MKVVKKSLAILMEQYAVRSVHENADKMAFTNLTTKTQGGPR
jgi:hypothetical protein